MFMCVFQEAYCGLMCNSVKPMGVLKGKMIYFLLDLFRLYYRNTIRFSEIVFLSHVLSKGWYFPIKISLSSIGGKNS